MSQDRRNSEHDPARDKHADETLPTDTIVAQWRRVRPDIDARPMAVCGDIWRTGERLRQAVLTNLTPHGLDFAGFDVLLTLRRQGSGQALTPSDLAQEMMLPSSTMTNRLDKLEKRGLIARAADPHDRRAIRVSLTEQGIRLADEIVVAHVATEERMLSALSEAERTLIRRLLAKIAAAD